MKMMRATKVSVVGVPKEIKTHEYRVGLTPTHVKQLVGHGTKVVVGKDAGMGSGFSNEDYIKAGAYVMPNESVYKESEMIVKVKEPQESEYAHLHRGQVLFTYFHFASSKTLTDAMVKSGAVCIAYETVRKSDGSLPLLTPMSEIAGLLSVQEGMKFMEKPQGGTGVLMSGGMIKSVKTCGGIVVVIGGGVVGTSAAHLAACNGANVYIIDNSKTRALQVQTMFGGFSNVSVVVCEEPKEMIPYLEKADLVVGAVLLPFGKQAPKLVTDDMIGKMRKGAVFVDVSIDQGGISVVSRPTTHEDPVFTHDGVTFYCVANMPGAVPVTSTDALTKATFPYVEQLVTKGWQNAIRSNIDLICGVNVANSLVTNKAIADLFGYTYTDPLHLTY